MIRKEKRFTVKFYNRKKLRNRRSGGLCVGVSNTIVNEVKFLESKSKFVKWFTYSAKSNSLEKAILFGLVYIPPRGSAFTSITCFEELQEDLLNFNADNKFHVCLLGDYNAHTGKGDDYVTLDSYIYVM